MNKVASWESTSEEALKLVRKFNSLLKKIEQCDKESMERMPILQLDIAITINRFKRKV